MGLRLRRMNEREELLRDRVDFSTDGVRRPSRILRRRDNRGRRSLRWKWKRSCLGGWGIGRQLSRLPSLDDGGIPRISRSASRPLSLWSGLGLRMRRLLIEKGRLCYFVDLGGWVTGMVWILIVGMGIVEVVRRILLV